MAVPTSRDEFKEFVLRALGKPVIEINVADEQLEDRIDQALSFYWDYHFDGTELTYYKHEITQADVDNQYIKMPQNIIGAVSIFDIGSISSISSSSSLFSIEYQITLNELYSLSAGGSLINYVSLKNRMGLMHEILMGKTPIRYNRHRNILHLDESKSSLKVGSFLVVQAYKVVDPEVYEDVWGDRWLQKYTEQQVKRQWGANLTKFEGMQLPGGVTFNGQKMYDDAQEQITKMEEEMIMNYSLPVMDMIG